MSLNVRSWLLLAVVSLAATLAPAREISLPRETLTWRTSDLPGFALVEQNCRECHSPHYAEYQPTSSPRSYSEAQVKRMKAIFKAPLQDGDIPLIVDYLVRTYGAESGH